MHEKRFREPNIMIHCVRSVPITVADRWTRSTRVSSNKDTIGYHTRAICSLQRPVTRTSCNGLISTNLFPCMSCHSQYIESSLHMHLPDHMRNSQQNLFHACEQMDARIFCGRQSHTSIPVSTSLSTDINIVVSCAQAFCQQQSARGIIRSYTRGLRTYGPNHNPASARNTCYYSSLLH